MKRLRFIVQVVLLTSIFLSACAKPEPITDGNVSVGDYSLYIHCVGEGTPTVVLDSGLTLTSGIWNQVIGSIPSDLKVRACVYDRAGQGKSEGVPTEARTTQDVVDDLHNLLLNAHIPKPYVMVGHSISGYTVRVYTNQYPKDVVGVILVDATPVGWMPREAELLPIETEDESETMRKYRQSCLNLDPMQTPEKLDIVTSQELVSKAGDLGARPLIVLTRDVNDPRPQLALMRMVFGDDFPYDQSVIINAEWKVFQEELAALSTNSTHIIVEGASHLIPFQAPKVVVEAIEDVVRAVRE
jgi:pimeloyl-ACP methyl ester carboxylesterase